MTYTFDKDTGIITFNGTHTESAEYVMYITATSKSFPIDVKISGLPEGAGQTTYYFGGSNVGYKLNDAIIPANTSFALAIVIKKDVVCDNLVFRPMVRPFWQTATNWNPYSMRLQDLTKIVSRSARIERCILTPGTTYTFDMAGKVSQAGDTVILTIAHPYINGSPETTDSIGLYYICYGYHSGYVSTLFAYAGVNVEKDTTKTITLTADPEVSAFCNFIY